MLRVEVGARALRNPVGIGGGAARVFACGGGWYKQASTSRKSRIKEWGREQIRMGPGTEQ